MPTLRLLEFESKLDTEDAVELKFDDFAQTTGHDLQLGYASLQRLISVNGLRLYKIDKPEKDVATVGPLMDQQLFISPTHTLDRFWPNGPVEAPDIIHVIIFSKARHLNSHPPHLNNPHSRPLQSAEAQAKPTSYLSTLSASQAARLPEFRTLQQNTREGPLNGRPLSHTGPPIGLYHPVFDQFTSQSDFVSPSDSVGDIPAAFYAETDHLMTRSQELYENEAERESAIYMALKDLLEHDIIKVERGGATPDGAVLSGNGGTCMIIEVENEIGAGGGSDPSIRGAISYTKYWEDQMVAKIRQQCCCPSFILAIAGPWMCVLGAVMLDRPVVEPLTDYLWVANSSRSQLRLRRLARVFWALKHSLENLRDYYLSLKSRIPVPARFYPYVQQYSYESKIVNFTYQTRLGSPGSLKPVFQARTEALPGLPAQEIVVKFPESYNSTAHQLLANHNLAPQLLFSSNIPDSSRLMVVMEYIDAPDLTTATPDIISTVRPSIERAIHILHRHDIVFGDLWRPNILALRDENGRATGGMLVDFDWCGIHGQKRYSTTMNTTEIERPVGADRGAVMLKEHDWSAWQWIVDRLV
ncbi:hypothetical protein FRC09_018798 [Ceratobasidium sp. 395]|nr:hypothetical protein FRC09_018798 [Ceratobasidium sp. 395]